MGNKWDLIRDIKLHEGSNIVNDRHLPYMDSVGKLTIGWGRNLTDRGISTNEAELLLTNDLARLELDCLTIVPSWHRLSSVRQDALMNMCYNLGLPKLAQFKRFLAAIDDMDWHLAAIEMLNSKWAGQVGDRALYLAHMIEFGTRPL